MCGQYCILAPILPIHINFGFVYVVEKSVKVYHKFCKLNSCTKIQHYFDKY